MSWLQTGRWFVVVKDVKTMQSSCSLRLHWKFSRSTFDKDTDDIRRDWRKLFPRDRTVKLHFTKIKLAESFPVPRPPTTSERRHSLECIRPPERRWNWYAWNRRRRIYVISRQQVSGLRCPRYEWTRRVDASEHVHIRVVNLFCENAHVVNELVLDLVTHVTFSSFGCALCFRSFVDTCDHDFWRQIDDRQTEQVSFARLHENVVIRRRAERVAENFIFSFLQSLSAKVD